MPPTPSFSRMHFPEIGKRTDRIRVSVSPDMHRDIRLHCKRLGYDGDISDWLFDVVLKELYGPEYVASLYHAQVRRIEQLLASGGPSSENSVPNGVNP